jgi:hypothetical protein
MFRSAFWRALGCVGFLAAGWWIGQAQSGSAPAGNWYKGNLHTHTINSDGDSSPDVVARWYKEHRYHFLVLTDHNFLTSIDGLNALLGAAEKFLLVRGEEVTDRFEKKPIHVNALDLHTLVQPQGGSSVVETIQRNVDAIRKAGAMPSINHPNFGWAITADELKRVENDKLFELYNGHPQVNNLGGGGSPGLEQVWDMLLTAGRRMHGIAVDDAHHFQQWGPQYSNPGRGWVSVRARELSAKALMEAIDRGDFYASTGVELSEMSREGGTLRVGIKVSGPLKYTTEFIGENGRVLKTSFDNPANYTLGAGERYVRAKITDSNGAVAWTQPVFGGSS